MEGKGGGGALLGDAQAAAADEEATRTSYRYSSSQTWKSMRMDPTRATGKQGIRDFNNESLKITEVQDI